jgi:hypothetical protein
MRMRQASRPLSFAAWVPGIVLQLQQFIFDAGGNCPRQLAELLLSGGQEENGIIRLFAFYSKPQNPKKSNSHSSFEWSVATEEEE